MSAGKNPLEFSDLEWRVKSRREAEPSEVLRAWIIQAVDDELSRAAVPLRNGGDFLSFAAAMAAVLVLAFNLSIISTSATAFESHAKITRRQAVADANALQQLSPDLSNADAMRICIFLQAGGGVAPVPEIQPVRSRSDGQTVLADPERNVR